VGVSRSAIICILGEVRVGDTAGPIGSFPRTLLARLAVSAGTVVHRDDLIDELWSGTAPPTARAALRVHASVVRRSLEEAGIGPALQARDGGYCLDLSPAVIDFNVGAAILDDAQRAHLDGRFGEALTFAERAAALFDSTPFGGTIGLAAFAPVAARCALLRERAVDELRRTALILGKGPSILGDLEAAYRDSPDDEHLLAQLMHGLYQAGRHAEALHHYRTYRQSLIERGLDPGPTLTDMETAILRHQPALWARRDDIATRQRFIGRDHDMANMTAAAGTGRNARVIVVEGAAGIGKSRLVAEWCRQHVPTDSTVLWGACSPERAIPFEPYVAALGSRSSHTGHTQIAKIDGDIAADHRRTRVFDELIGQIFPFTEGPVVLVLDDIHWADPASVSFTRHLAEIGRHRQLLIILVARIPELADNPDAVHLAGDLARTLPVQRVGLAGLTPADTRNLVISLLTDGGGTEAMVDSLCAMTEGNPLFVTEYVKSLGTSTTQATPGAAWPVPAAIRDVLGRRIAQASPMTKRFLAGAAVLGRSFRFDRAAELTRLAEFEAFDALDQAMKLAFVEPTSELDRFTFHHELLRVTAEQSIPAIQRQRHHLAAATLVAADSAEHGEILRHLLEAGSLAAPERVSAAAAAAAEWATDACAFEMAGEFVRIGLLREVEPSPVRARLLVTEGVVASIEGRPGEAAAAFQEAMGLAARFELDETFAMVLGAQQLYGLYEFDPQMALSLEGLAARARKRGDESSLLRALYALSYVQRHHADRSSARAAAEEALAIASRGSDQTALSRAHHAMYHVLFVEGAPIEERDSTNRAGIAAAALAGDALSMGLHHVSLVSTAMVRGDLLAAERAHRLLRESTAVARWPLGVWLVQSIAISLDLCRGAGDVEQSINRLAGDDVSRGIAAAAPSFAAQLLVLRWAQGRLGELEPLLRSFHVGEPSSPLYAHAHALALTELGRDDEAASIFDAALTATVSAPLRNWLWIPELVFAAEVCCRVGSRSQAAEVVPLLERFAGQHAVIGEGSVASLGPLDRVRANLLGRLGFIHDAEALLGETVIRCHDGGVTLWERITADNLLRWTSVNHQVPFPAEI
jgi:DNA-binding SARP family transcriptional activator